MINEPNGERSKDLLEPISSKLAEHPPERVAELYQALINTIPDPVFLADSESGTVVGANGAAEELLGEPREELVGMDQSELHPAENEGEYRELFEQHVAEGGNLSRLADGSQVYVVDGSGTKIPVEISAEPFSIGGRQLIHGVFRDISEQIAYEQTVTRLHETVSNLLEASTVVEISNIIVKAAVDILQFDHVGVLAFEGETGVFNPIEVSSGLEVSDNDPDSLPLGNPQLGTVFSEGVTKVFSPQEIPEIEIIDGGTVEQILAVPIGSHGIMIVVDESGSGFPTDTIELTELMIGSSISALDRVNREFKLRKRDRKLAERNDELNRLKTINERIRRTLQVAIEAETRAEIEQTICKALVEIDRFSLVWIGEINPIQNTVEPRAMGGGGYRYLDSIDLNVTDSDDSEPTVKTAVSGEITHVPNVGMDLLSEPWRKEALVHEYKSVLSIPLAYNGISYGVLSLYADRPSSFTGERFEILNELGDVVTYAINAIERRNAVLTDQYTELEFAINDPNCFCKEFAEQTQSNVQLKGMLPQSDESVIVFVEVAGTDPDNFFGYINDSHEIEQARLLTEDESTALFSVRISGEFIGVVLADHGFGLSEISTGPSTCSLEVTVTPTNDPRKAVEVVQSVYPEATLVSKREQDPADPPDKQNRIGVMAELTERQREVIQLAYHGGYYDSPKQVSGNEIADMLEISSSAFHNNLRAAERKIFESFLENRPRPREVN